MNAIDKALKIVGLTHDDYAGRDFYKRSGRKAAAALRKIGYRQERMKTMVSGQYATRWLDRDGKWASWDYRPAFDLLSAAVARGEWNGNG